jgi:hypothetical protein
MSSIASCGARLMFATMVVFLMVAGRPAVAQEPDPVATARIHLGPLGLNPGVGLANVGVDNNVFNETANPKRDFTFTIGPTLSVVMRTKRGLLTTDGHLDFVYFNTYKSERSVNGFSEATYAYAFNRLKPFASFSALDTRERPGYEIDARVRRFENTLHAGLDARVAGRSNVQLGFRRQTVNYAGNAYFLNRRLEDVLNRTLSAVDADWRLRLTPLTTLLVSGSREQERFTFSPVRNSNSFRLRTGLDLGLLALIRGTAMIGYRRLTPSAGGTLPQFSGVTADVNVSYTAPTQTRLSTIVSRDIQYSYDVLSPYYVQTSWTIGLTQRVIGKWEARLSGGQDRLAYRSTLSSTAIPRVDRVDRLGAGVGYALSGGASAGFVVESFFRSSNQPGLRYQTIRSFGSVNYGF